ncbi:hypothetical protein ACE1AT_11460 [Pelatocladus sp. BLCC-F211]|uniref:hypothetical protein n=1 Tax=Pelatocladus sp. BLCC-F211 TaxID=3342752 RepID=UPI0035B8D64C
MNIEEWILVSTLTINILQVAKLTHDIIMAKDIRRGVKASLKNNAMLCEICKNTIALQELQKKDD